jgi:CAAX prenyl protease-like protein
MSLLPAGSAPYVAPYAAFLLFLELQGRVASAAAPLFVARVAVPALLFAWFWRRGAYPELRSYRADARTLLDVAVGVAIAALWVGPYLLWPSLPRGEPFDPALLGADERALTLGVRLLGFALVTPFVEELFVRSFLLRFADAFERGDFRQEPIARFTLRSFLVTVGWFTFTHAPWEWWVALPAGIAFNAWLYWRREIGACVVAHAAANAAVWALVVLGPLPLWEFL